MNRSEIEQKIKGLNEYMLSDSNKELILLKISNDYTYNKAIAIIDKSMKNKDWYSIGDKNCYKTWNEIEAFIEGLCRGKNTNFYKKEKEK